jgi:hypothetical protein
MVLPLPPLFPHRRNKDGTFDSICLKCLLTIANARIEADLAKCEKYHVCIPSILLQRLLTARTEIVGTSPEYLADYVVSHRGNKHSGCVVLPAECAPTV